MLRPRGDGDANGVILGARSLRLCLKTPTTPWPFFSSKAHSDDVGRVQWRTDLGALRGMESLQTDLLVHVAAHGNDSAVRSSIYDAGNVSRDGGLHLRAAVMNEAGVVYRIIDVHGTQQWLRLVQNLRAVGFSLQIGAAEYQAIFRSE